MFEMWRVLSNLILTFVTIHFIYLVFLHVNKSGSSRAAIFEFFIVFAKNKKDFRFRHHFNTNAKIDENDSHQISKIFPWSLLICAFFVSPNPYYCFIYLPYWLSSRTVSYMCLSEWYIFVCTFCVKELIRDLSLLLILFLSWLSTLIFLCWMILLCLLLLLGIGRSSKCTLLMWV